MSSQPNQSLIDGLACLQFLASARKPVGCRELARALDLNHMRANRLLKTLAGIGLARQDQKRKYAIGPGIHALTAQSIFGSSILKQALPLIKAIKHREVTLAIGVLWRGYVTYLLHGRVSEGLENCIGRIGLIPCFNSSIGRLLLAFEDDAEIERLHANAESGLTKRQLMSSIRKIRKQNYAEVRNETSAGLAVPIGAPPLMGIAFAGIPGDEDPKPYLAELRHISEQIQV